MDKIHVETNSDDSVSATSDSDEADNEYEDSDNEEIHDQTINSGSSDAEEGVGEPASKSGLADAMAKILGKNIQGQHQVILAKGATDKEISRKRQPEQEQQESYASQQKKKLWENLGRTKPDPLEKDKERALQRIAQRGVVQLFNAVRKQQKVMEEKLEEAGPSERKREKVEESFTKGKFLDLLKNAGNTKNEVKEEKWGALRDDFMMGASMKDWDKESEDDLSPNENT